MTDDRARQVNNPPGIRLGAAPTIRVASKALIVRDGHLLVTVNSGEQSTFYLCPGGGHDHGEDAPTALRRECREEIGCEVVVGWVHQIEAYFHCELVPGGEPGLTGEGDTFQTGVAWIPLDGLADQPLWPKALASWLALPEADRPGYLGNVN